MPDTSAVQALAHQTSRIFVTENYKKHLEVLKDMSSQDTGFHSVISTGISTGQIEAVLVHPQIHNFIPLWTYFRSLLQLSQKDASKRSLTQIAGKDYET